MTEIILNDVHIKAENFKAEKAGNQKGEKELSKISFSFKVSSSEYHDITVLLFGLNFNVCVPEFDMEFPATILNYSTSITNLYKENEVGDFSLELIEITE
jgi:hypothetical protein